MYDEAGNMKQIIVLVNEDPTLPLMYTSHRHSFEAKKAHS